MRKTSDKPQLRNIQRNAIQNSQCHHKQGKSEKLSQLNAISGDMTTKYDMASWTGSWNRKKAP